MNYQKKNIINCKSLKLILLIFEYLKGKKKKMCGLNRLMVDLFIYVGRLFIAEIKVELTI